jgi:hypothetical protein
VTAGDFEAVDVCSLMVDVDSGQAASDSESDEDCLTVGD